MSNESLDHIAAVVLEFTLIAFLAGITVGVCIGFWVWK